jgi:hypothetical protein
MEIMLKYFVLYSVKKQHDSHEKNLHIAFSLKAVTDKTWVIKCGTEIDSEHLYKLLLSKSPSINEHFKIWDRTNKN